MSDVCPVCGSKDCRGFSSASLELVVCPRCSSKRFVGMVKERSLELAVVDFKCSLCGHVWSDVCPLPKDFVAKAVVWRV